MAFDQCSVAVKLKTQKNFFFSVVTSRLCWEKHFHVNVSYELLAIADLARLGRYTFS